MRARVTQQAVMVEVGPYWTCYPMAWVVEAPCGFLVVYEGEEGRMGETLPDAVEVAHRHVERHLVDAAFEQIVRDCE